MNKTTVKIRFRASTVDPACGVLVLHVTRHRRTRNVTLSYKLRRSEWDEEKQCIIAGDPAGAEGENAAPRQGCSPELSAMSRKLRRDLRLVFREIAFLESRSGDYSAGDVLRRFSRCFHPVTLREYIAERRNELCPSGKISTARCYVTALNSLTRFLNGAELPLDKLDARLMILYEQYLLKKKLKPNTVSNYMRSLSALYRHAVKSGVVTARKENPFASVFTGYARTEHRALPVKTVEKLGGISVPPHMELSLMIFLFCLLSQGMSHIDAISLTKDNIRNGYIVYVRRKTGRTVYVKLLPEIRAIIERYRSRHSAYLFPVLRAVEGSGDPERLWRTSGTALSRLNRHLKAIGVMAGIETPLTSYVARHTWATTASLSGVPVGVISRALGHESERTTEIYIDALRLSEIGRATAKVARNFDRILLRHLSRYNPAAAMKLSRQLR